MGRWFATEHEVALNAHIGRRIEQRRKQLRMTQSKLARAVGVKFKQIYKYESGETRIPAGRLWLIANALKVPIAYFFEGFDNAITR